MVTVVSMSDKQKEREEEREERSPMRLTYVFTTLTLSDLTEWLQLRLLDVFECICVCVCVCVCSEGGTENETEIQTIEKIGGK